MVKITQPKRESTKIAYICFRLSPPSGRIPRMVGENIMAEYAEISIREIKLQNRYRDACFRSAF